MQRITQLKKKKQRRKAKNNCKGQYLAQYHQNDFDEEPGEIPNHSQVCIPRSIPKLAKYGK